MNPYHRRHYHGTATFRRAKIPAAAAITVPLIPSFGFSGAGFLAGYHLGVVACLQERAGLLLPAPSPTSSSNTTTWPPVTRLTGVSGGALVAAATACGVAVEDGRRAILEVSRQARACGPLDALHPGFSLIDAAETALATVLRDAVGGCHTDEEDALLQHINEHGLLQIGLTDRRRAFPSAAARLGGRFNHNDDDDAFVVVDRYRTVDDVLAAGILSSYVPLVTGPLQGNRCRRNPAVQRASVRLREMVRAGGVVRYSRGSAGRRVSFNWRMMMMMIRPPPPLPEHRHHHHRHQGESCTGTVVWSTLFQSLTGTRWW